MIPLLRAVALAFALAPLAASAVLPREIARAFLDQGVPLDHVGIVVQETGPRTRPLFTLQPDRAMNPASVMKLVTTFAALELLGRPAGSVRRPLLDLPSSAREELRGTLVEARLLAG